MDREKIEEKKKKTKLTRKSHHMNFVPRLQQPRLQQLDLRRLAAAVQPFEHDERPSFLFLLSLLGHIALRFAFFSRSSYG